MFKEKESPKGLCASTKGSTLKCNVKKTTIHRIHEGVECLEKTGKVKLENAIMLFVWCSACDRRIFITDRDYLRLLILTFNVLFDSIDNYCFQI